MEIVKDLVEKSYKNNGKPWKSLRNLHVKTKNLYNVLRFRICFCTFLNGSSFLFTFTHRSSYFFIFFMFLSVSSLVFLFFLYLLISFDFFSFFFFLHFFFILSFSSFFHFLFFFVVLLFFSLFCLVFVFFCPLFFLFLFFLLFFLLFSYSFFLFFFCQSSDQIRRQNPQKNAEKFLKTCFFLIFLVFLSKKFHCWQ